MARMTMPAAVAAVMLLGGCSIVSDTLFPSLSGDDPQPRAAAKPAAAPTQLGTTSFEPPAVTPGSSTGTIVGAKITQMRAELGRLQTGINQHNTTLQSLRQQTVAHAQRYHGTVAAINSRLQVGTTPGNPILVSQWNTAQIQLDGVSRDIANMNSLANRVASDSSTASYLLETTRATYCNQRLTLLGAMRTTDDAEPIVAILPNGRTITIPPGTSRKVVWFDLDGTAHTQDIPDAHP